MRFFDYLKLYKVMYRWDERGPTCYLNIAASDYGSAEDTAHEWFERSTTAFKMPDKIISIMEDENPLAVGLNIRKEDER